MLRFLTLHKITKCIITVILWKWKNGTIRFYEWARNICLNDLWQSKEVTYLYKPTPTVPVSLQIAVLLPSSQKISCSVRALCSNSVRHDTKQRHSTLQLVMLISRSKQVLDMVTCCKHGYEIWCWKAGHCGIHRDPARVDCGVLLVTLHLNGW